MQKHLSRIIDDFQLVPKSIIEVVAAYTLYLMLETKGHQTRFAARLTGKHRSSFSRMLNRPDNLTIAKGCLNRAVRRRLAAVGKQGKNVKALLILMPPSLAVAESMWKTLAFTSLGRRRSVAISL